MHQSFLFDIPIYSLPVAVNPFNLFLVLLNEPLYLQTWFQLLAGIFFLVAGPLFYHYRTRALNRRNELLEARVRERTAIIEKQTEELRQLDLLKSRFFDNVSHELRTPLSLITGPLDSLLKQDYLHENDHRLLEIVQHNSRQLLALVNEILDLSKLEAGKMEVKETIVNWHDALQPTLAQFGSIGNSASVNLSFEFRADTRLRIYLDLNKFDKIITNFLSNAFKFTPKGGKVEFIAEDLGDQLQVSVKDNGPGIHPEDLLHIFERFYQPKDKSTLLDGSTGIGMSLVKELAELLKGKVWAESVAGQGSSFYFRFPKKIVLPADLQSVEQDPPENDSLPESIESMMREEKSFPPECDPGKNHILVVEDNAGLREYLGIILAGYHVTTAENGKIAIDMMQNALKQKITAGGGLCRPDLIISDIVMPVTDGLQLLEWVKSRDEYRHVPFIMLTARADMKIKLHALRVGVDDYLTKPFVEEELKTRVRNLLGHYRERISAIKEQVVQENEGKAMENVVIGTADAVWLEKVEAIFHKNLNDSHFKIEWAAFEMNLSERQFNRRIKQLTGLTPVQYLREIRLQTAKDFLHEGKFNTVKEIGVAVGFNDTVYFSKLFREHFGMLPSDYLK